MNRPPPISTLFPSPPLSHSPRRDRKSGWMQLELTGGGAKLSLDSRIVGFGEVVRRATEAAAARHLQVSESTATNLEALGVRRSEEHTSELQSRQYLVCRLLLEKKKK